MQERKGLPTRLMLVAALVLVVTSVTVSSLLAVRARLQAQALADFSGDLAHSADIFRASDAERLAALRRENALLADLPSLKALMTTSDPGTIADGAVRFWKVSGSDLFALKNNEGALMAVNTRGAGPGEQLRRALGTLPAAGNKRFLLADGRLFEYSVQPLFFGAAATGTLLGYVVSGYAVDGALVRQTTQTSAAEVAFISRSRLVTSTLNPALWDELYRQLVQPGARYGAARTVPLGGQRYLTSVIDLSRASSEPLYLVVTKSFAHADEARRELNRLLMVVGACALFAGTLLMLAVSGFITGPLELLTRSVRGYGKGAHVPVPPAGGTREVRELSGAFVAMSAEIRETNRALLESERLATIGRMASSVSHDLRHYLAAVYANAEFLVSSTLSEAERAELFGEIRMAVHGTTDLIDSLLIFSRATGSAPRQTELLAYILERALALVRAHPDAQGICLCAPDCDAGETAVIVDARQVQRAIFNLILNACQAARGSGGEPHVTTEMEVRGQAIELRVVDSGAGVADTVRHSMFEPFVSEGKQNGTGLGLTMAHVVAREHGGSVELIRSQPGETVFALSLPRAPGREEFAGLESAQESSR